MVRHLFETLRRSPLYALGVLLLLLLGANLLLLWHQSREREEPQATAHPAWNITPGLDGIILQRELKPKIEAFGFNQAQDRVHHAPVMLIPETFVLSRPMPKGALKRLRALAKRFGEAGIDSLILSLPKRNGFLVLRVGPLHEEAKIQRVLTDFSAKGMHAKTRILLAPSASDSTKSP